MDLKGKKALVTGGSGDIGRAICVELARAGVEVAFSYFSDHEGAEATEKAIQDAEGISHTVRCNLAEPNKTSEFVSEVVEKLGHIDIFVSNAASGVLRPALEVKAKHWQWTMDVNARALLTITQELLNSDPPRMGKGGRIIAVSSLGASRAIPQYTVIGASKAALESVARHLALDIGERGITVNVVSPGIVDTKALQYFPNREQLLDAAGRRTPLGRIATPEDIAPVVTFLCSDGARMVHGQTLTVDGGYSTVA